VLYIRITLDDSCDTERSE
jgi:hypothetical protein